jgi:D-alanyl-D-alanine carboxypeptidase
VQQKSNVEAWADRAQPLIAAFQEATGVPGVALAFVNRAGDVHYRSSGVANLNLATPIDKDTRFQIGSISKSFVAIAVLIAHREGRLSLDASIDQYLPDIKSSGASINITINSLLTHTSGLPMGMSYSPESRHEALAAVRALNGKHAGQWYYSNIGYDLLGYVLESIYNECLASILTQKVFDVLGMSSTLGAITADARAGVATGYASINEHLPRLKSDALVEAPWEPATGAAGCIISTPNDMAQYARALLNNGENLLNAAELAKLISPMAPATGGREYALGWFVQALPHGNVVMHTGGMLGYKSYMALQFDAGLAVILLTNIGIGHNTVGARFCDALIASAFESELKAQPKSLQTCEQLLRPKIDAVDYLGVYYLAGSTARLHQQSDAITIETSGGQFVARDNNGGAFELQWFEKDRCLATRPSWRAFEIAFIRDEQGLVTSFEHGAKVFVREGFAAPVASISIIESDTSELQALQGTYRSTNKWCPVVRVTLTRGRVLMHALDLVMPITRSSDNVNFEIEGTPETVTFTVGADGRANTVNLSGCIYFRESLFGAASA